ncbi:MAG: transcriptional regulator TrmB [Alphaproteobacteria bacterium]|nr:transcriptional regulator TrmB [Rhodobiaceae bacterium]MBO6544698.1 transcriptional regulator TrmB [Alphaproteobacteria bacterium]MDF1625456.1 helix-turn-helix domain-containing protein [Parvibaculaceae bacterium]
MSIKTDKLESSLAAIGMSGKRARFYLSALTLGEASVNEIAQHCGVTRTTAYALVDKLRDDGVITELQKNGKTRIMAENPDVLLRNLEDRRASLETLLPDLQAVYEGAARGPKFRVYEGRDGVLSVLNAVLVSAREEVCGILSMKELLDFPGEEALQNFISKRVERGVKLRVVRSASEDVKNTWASNREEQREVRFTRTPAPLGMTSFIYEGHVALVSAARENYGLVIESPAFANLQRMLFEALWVNSK